MALASGLGQAWRILASGIAFSVFGVFGVLVSLTVFPLLYLLPVGRERRQMMSRRVIGFCFGCFVRLLQLLRLIDPHMDELKGFSIAEPSVIIANHPTLVDVVYLLSCLPSARCIVKQGVWNNPCMRIPVRSSGYIPNHHTEQLLEDCVASIQSGQSVIIFPEGSRSHPGGLRKFQRGFAAMAVRAQCPVLPIMITCTPPTLSKGRPWYSMANRCCDLVLQPQKAFDIHPFTNMGESPAIAARSLTEAVENFYAEELRGYYSEQHIERSGTGTEAVHH